MNLVCKSMAHLFSNKRTLLLGWLALSFAAWLTPVSAKPLGPVTIIENNSSQVMTAHASRYKNIVYIGGLVDRPSFAAIGAHVHVWGLGKDNAYVFFKTTSVVFTGDPSLIRTESYLISVSSAVAAKANTIYVTFHNIAHADAHRMK